MYRRRTKYPYARRTKKQRDGDKLVTKRSLKRTLNKSMELKQAVFGYDNNTVVSRTSGNIFMANLSQGNADAGLAGQTAPLLISKNPGRQGTGGFQHIGNEILVKSFGFYGRFSSTAPNSSSDIVRMLVVHDTRNSGNVLETSEFLWDVGNGAGVTSPIKINGLNSYKILMDKTVLLHQYESTEGLSTDPYVLKYKKTFKTPLKCTFYPDTDSVGSAGVQDNGLYLVVIASTGNVVYNGMYSTLEYYDA